MIYRKYTEKEGKVMRELQYIRTDKSGIKEVVMDKECCGNCHHYWASLCTRWPVKIKTRALFWCGEWKKRDEKKRKQRRRDIY